jgi:hypothetical protein
VPTTTLPLSHELVVYAGTTFRREFRWRPDGDGLQDFTGWSALARIGPAQGHAVIELSTGNGGVLLTAVGQIVLSIAPAQTTLLAAGAYSYNLDLTGPDGTVTRFLRGRVQVIADVGPPA